MIVDKWIFNCYCFFNNDFCRQRKPCDEWVRRFDELISTLFADSTLAILTRFYVQPTTTNLENRNGCIILVYGYRCILQTLLTLITTYHSCINYSLRCIQVQKARFIILRTKRKKKQPVLNISCGLAVTFIVDFRVYFGGKFSFVFFKL